jgi:hypothetical protein
MGSSASHYRKAGLVVERQIPRARKTLSNRPGRVPRSATETSPLLPIQMGTDEFLRGDALRYASEL